MTQGPFEFHREEDGSLPVESAVYQAIGAASVCWSETPQGVFDSDKAKMVGDALLEYLGRPQTSPVAGERIDLHRKPERDSVRFGEDL